MKKISQKSKFPENQFKFPRNQKIWSAPYSLASFRQVTNKKPKSPIPKNGKTLKTLVIQGSNQVSKKPKGLQKKFQVSRWLNLLWCCLRGKFPRNQTSPPPLHGG